MATIDIKYGGVSIIADVLLASTSFESKADGQVGQAVVRIKDVLHTYTPGTFAGVKKLELYINGSREWDGWGFHIKRGWAFDVDDTSDPETTPRFWTIIGLDRNVLYTKRQLFRQNAPADDSGLKLWPAGTSDKKAIDYALTHYVDLTGLGLDISSGIEQIASPGSGEEFTLAHVGADLGVLFADCQKITGGVFYIDPDRVMRYVDDRTVSAPWALSDDPSSGQIGYRDLDAALDYDQSGNEALVWGAGRGSSKPVFARYRNKASVAAYGLWQWASLFVGAWKQKTVKERARTYVEGSPSHRIGHKDPVPVVSCIIFEHGLRVAHVVDFYATQYGYNDQLPVRKIKMTFPSSTDVQYGVEMSLMIDTPFGAPDLWPQLPTGPGETGQTPDPKDPHSTFVDGLLIDDFDRQGTMTHFTRKGTSYYDENHVITLPDAPREVGDVALVLLAPDNEESLPGSITGWSDEAGEESPAAAYEVFARVLDGTEGFTGVNDTITWTVEAGSDPHSTHWVTVIVKGADGIPQFSANINSGYTKHFKFANDLAGASGDNLWMGFGVRGGIGSWVDGTAHTWWGDPPVLGPVDPGWVVDQWGSPTVIADTGELLPFALAHWYDRSATSGVRYFEAARDHSAFGDGNAVTFVFRAADDTATDALGYTPGPEITGAPWPGGNAWDNRSGPPGSGYGVADSHLYAGATAKNFGVYFGKSYYLDGSGDYDPPSVSQDKPWSPIADRWASFMGRFTLTDSPTFSLWVSFWQVEEDQPYWRRNDDLVVRSDGELWLIQGSGWWNDYAIQGGRVWDIDRPYLFRLEYIEGGEFGASQQQALTAASYVNSRVWRDWYGGADPGGEGPVPLEDTGTVRVKVWAEDTEEPDEWDIEVPEFRYATSEPSPRDPDGPLENAPDEVPPAYSGVGPTPLGYSDSKFWPRLQNAKLDWLLVTSWVDPKSGERVEAGVGLTSETILSSTGVYTTRYPYMAETLSVWLEGQRLREGVDFIESDPDAGQFRLMSGQGLSASLVVRYERRGLDAILNPGAYRPAPVRHAGWGTALDGYNAMMACSVMALDRHTMGKYTTSRGLPLSTPPVHRSKQPDQVGATSLAAVETAWSNGWGQTFTRGTTITWSWFEQMVKSGRGAILQGDYASLPASKRTSSTFLGGHAIYVNERFSNGNFLGIDPDLGYALVYTAQELKDYSAGLAGAGLVSAGYTQVTT